MANVTAWLRGRVVAIGILRTTAGGTSKKIEKKSEKNIVG